MSDAASEESQEIDISFNVHEELDDEAEGDSIVNMDVSFKSESNTSEKKQPEDLMSQNERLKEENISLIASECALKSQMAAILVQLCEKDEELKRKDQRNADLQAELNLLISERSSSPSANSQWSSNRPPRKPIDDSSSDPNKDSSSQPNKKSSRHSSKGSSKSRSHDPDVPGSSGRKKKKSHHNKHKHSDWSKDV